MRLEYKTFVLANQILDKNANDLQEIFNVNDLTLICTLHFDTDSVSDTYNHWVCVLDVVSDTEDIPERSITLYPNTIHFDGDTLYTVVISSELESIGHDDLPNAYITIGVPSNE